ncbi:hypothetical protein LR48_Vigan10g111300 [Vigna angularis]|uniref:Uncharacterized protein n=1 Tax=Phaseolus angularis TaxID=3914 RepID=A0A0L9VJJ7_PHAAN|nr:hypothetical protein LR48_Vigan10g111300 [Vigna angularis]
MASSSHPSRDRGKAVVVARYVDPKGWISDEEIRGRFLRGKRIKTVVPHNYLNLNLFEKEGFHFQEWIETQGLSTFVQMKGDWYPNLVRVFYNNLKFVDGVIQSRVKGVNVHIDNNVWLQVAGLKAEGLFSHLRNSETNMWLKKRDVYRNWLRFLGRMTTKDVFLLYAIKNDVPTNWMAVIKDHMIDVGLNQAQYLPYVVFISKFLTLQGVDVNGEKKCSCNCSNVINRNTLTSIGLVKTMMGWCFKDEEDMVQSSGSIATLNEDRTNFFPKTNFERFVVEQFRYTNERITRLEGKIDNQQRIHSSSEGSDEEYSEEDSMEISESN